MKRALVIPSEGIGDALLMMIAAKGLSKKGYAVTIFHEGILSFGKWFPEAIIEPFNFEKIFQFDRVILQNDDRALTRKIRNERSKVSSPLFSIFYPRYVESKHGKLEKDDQVFDAKKTMVENIGSATQNLLGLSEISNETGIEIPSYLEHRKEKKRIIIHPTSRQEEKNWLLEKFLILAKKLKKKGYDPQFVVSSSERREWEKVASEGYRVCPFDQLTNLASYIYESGHLIGNDSLLGHLASLLGIPTTIIAKEKKHMALWRPSWLKGRVITSPFWLINCKGLRFREKWWKRTIFVYQVMRDFS